MRRPSRARAEREAEKEERRNELCAFTAEDHIAEAEKMIELGERQAMAPAAGSCYAAATAHATLAVAKATHGRLD